MVPIFTLGSFYKLFLVYRLTLFLHHVFSLLSLSSNFISYPFNSVSLVSLLSLLGALVLGFFYIFFFFILLSLVFIALFLCFFTSRIMLKSLKLVIQPLSKCIILTKHSKTPASRNAEQKWQSLLVVVVVVVAVAAMLLVSFRLSLLLLLWVLLKAATRRDETPKWGAVLYNAQSIE